MKLLDQDKIATLPGFPGFYESLLSSECDEQETYMVEWATEEGGEYEGKDQSALANAVYMCADYSAAHLDIARDYVAEWCKRMSQESGLRFGAFESMSSPREYNFSTDRAFITLPLSTLQSILDRVPRELLRQAIKEQFTSRSGFHSFYSADLDDWLEKPLSEWDHNECGTLLAVAQSHYWQSEVEWEIFEAIHDSFYSAVENCINWEKVRERMTEES